MKKIRGGGAGMPVPPLLQPAGQVLLGLEIWGLFILGTSEI